MTKFNPIVAIVVLLVATLLIGLIVVEGVDPNTPQEPTFGQEDVTSETADGAQGTRGASEDAVTRSDQTTTQSREDTDAPGVNEQLIAQAYAECRAPTPQEYWIPVEELPGYGTEDFEAKAFYGYVPDEELSAYCDTVTGTPVYVDESQITIDFLAYLEKGDVAVAWKKADGLCKQDEERAECFPFPLYLRDLDNQQGTYPLAEEVTRSGRGIEATSSLDKVAFGAFVEDQTHFIDQKMHVLVYPQKLYLDDNGQVVHIEQLFAP
jgi:hypothetical protein